MELERDFEAKVRDAFAEKIVAWLRENDRAEQIIREAARDAIVAAGYEADSILDSLVGPVIDSNPPGDRLVRVVWAFEHEAARYFEFGTTDHQVDGDPLAIPIEELAPEIREQFDGDVAFFQSVNVSGLDETRFTRDSRAALRRAIQD